MREGWQNGLAFLASALLLVTIGCDSKTDERSPAEPTAYVDLVRTKESQSQEIINEIARLEADGWLLTPTSITQLGSEAESAVADDRSFTATFDPRLADSIYQSTAAIYMPEKLEFSSTQLAEAVRIRQSSDLFLTRLRNYLLPGPRDFGLDLRQGLLADTSFVSVVRAGHRLEALEAAAMLERGQIDSALDRLAGMLLISDRLDDIPHIVARLTAAELRSEAAYVAEAIANHSAADANTHLRLKNLISAQLARWPDDADVWRGDRALGIHAYEMMRSGELLSLLTDDEVSALKKQGNLFTIANQIVAQADQDQDYYLYAMRALIGSCADSYATRCGTIDSFEIHIASTRGTPEYPYLAGEVLLENLTQANEALAMDLATWRALNTLLGDSGGIDPFTSNPFVVVQAGDRQTIEFGRGTSRGRVISIRKLR